MTSHLRVLLVEDSAGDADLVREYLSQARQCVFEVERVPSLSLAISLLERVQVDVILLDLGLPDSSGLETLSRVLETAHGSPTVVLTGLDDEITGLEAVRLGAQDFLLKGSFAPDLLIRTVIYSIERKRMQDELRQAKERTESILASVDDAHIIFDTQWRYIYANEAAVRAIGRPPEQLLGVSMWEVYPDIIGTELETAYRRAMDQRVAISLEYYYLTTDTWWANRFYPCDAGLSVFATEITERKRAERALRESEEQFRSLFENSLDAILLTIPDGRILRANAAACQMFGMTEEEICRVGRGGVVNNADPRLKLAVEERKQTGKFQGELSFKRKDGSVFPTEVSSVLFKDDEGQWKSTMIIRDITDRKRSEEAQKRLATAAEQAAEAIVITDNQGIIQYVNPAFENITGYSHEEAIGQNPRLLKSGEHDLKFYEQMWGTIKAGKVWSGKLTNRTKEGTLYYEDATISPVKDSSGNIVNFVAVKRDITEHLELSRQLFQAQKMEAIGTLAGGVAHDFNNILQVALGYSELMLGDEGLPQRYKSDLRKINQSAKCGADLVHRLLTFSRKTEVKPLPLNLNRRINEVRKMLERTVPRMIEIQLLLAEDLATIMADPTQVDQILMNLAVNARDAMPDGGKLVIETANVCLDTEYAGLHLDAKPGRYVLLSVADTGVGMDKETLEHVFEPFYTTKEPGEGTGLGLATVYGIIQQHGGFIRCYSEPGQGATFKIYFPAIVSDEEAEEEPTKAMPQGGSETILLVDDEEIIRDLCLRILKKAGYNVITASDGKEALEVYRAEKERISLVILDLIMPQMGGKQCLEHLLSVDPDVRVVIASGYSAHVITQEALVSRARGFVNKPYNISQVLTVVRSVLDEEAPQ